MTTRQDRKDWWSLIVPKAALMVAAAAAGFALSTQVWQAKHEQAPHFSRAELIALEHRLTSIEHKLEALERALKR